jgi:hypothetical protein
MRNAQEAGKRNELPAYKSSKRKGMLNTHTQNETPRKKQGTVDV